MKRLILVRHGHAVLLSGQTDFERSLTKTGYEEALKAAEYLNSKSYHVDALFSSHADRALETARIIFDQDEKIDEIKIVEEFYNCTEETLLGFIRNLDPSINSIIIVGHNPAITSIITKFKINFDRSKLVSALNYEVTAKVVTIEFESHHWNGIENANVGLLDVFYP